MPLKRQLNSLFYANALIDTENAFLDFFSELASTEFNDDLAYIITCVTRTVPHFGRLGGNIIALTVSNQLGL